VSEALRVKELCLDRDVVLLVSDCTGEDMRKHPARRERNTALAAMLLNSCRGVRHGFPSSTRPTMNQVELVLGFLGKPELRVEGRKGPSVSFSHPMQGTWAALCLSGGSVGIDATDPREFVGAYPFDRVFHPEELRVAEAAIGSDRLACAALLWSSKEAVVKALGCGFHLIDPLDVRILPMAASRGISRAGVSFSDVTKVGFQALHDATVRVACFRESTLWVAIAVSSWTAALEADRQ
jgi:phosphopantetheinyl transferase